MKERAIKPAATRARTLPGASPRPSRFLFPRILHFCRFLLYAILAAALLFAAAWFAFPFPKDELTHYPAAMMLLDREGAPLRLRLGPNDTDCRILAHLDPGRDWICQAVVAAEDQRFWRHHGVDPLALGRAVFQNLAQGRVISGASTLSTQVVRLLHPRRRTFVTKIVEMFRALQLECLLDKRAILEQYLNRAPFGANLVGIEAASRHYFAREPQDLSLAEAALLAGLPQSPSHLRPDRFPERASRRQSYVLERMVACGMITPTQCAEAVHQLLALRRAPHPFRAPHFCDAVLEALAGPGLPGGVGAPRTDGARLGDWAASRGAGRAGRLPFTDGDRTTLPEVAVRTTLDPSLQRLAEEVLRRHAKELQPEGVFGGAVVVIEVRSGAVRALVGSPDYGDRQHAGQVDGAVAPRAAGSTLKPFVYALALDQGRITPATVLADIPRTFKDLAPADFDGDFTGLVPARAALVLSLNIPAITLVEQIGTDEVLRTLRQAGLETLNQSAAHYGLGLALGDASVRLLDLATAYACFARGGEWRPYRFVEDAVSQGGPAASRTAGPRAALTGRRVFSPETAWLVAEMLSGEERAETTTGHRADVRLPRVAWKTGTSSGFHDAWAVAFNPDYVIGVWIGNPDGKPSPALVGARAAVPVMWDVVRGLYPTGDAPWFGTPAGLAKQNVCAVSGAPAGPNCPASVPDWCIPGVSSARPCAIHVLQTMPDGRSQVAEVWPRDIETFLRRRTAPMAADVPGRTKDDLPRLVSPRPGAVYRKLDEMAADQRLPLKAECRGGNLYWFVDDQLVATVPASGSASWPLARGKHVVICSTAAGQAAKAEIQVE